MASGRRQYPHVDRIADQATKESIRLLWDRTFAAEEALTAASTTIAQQASTITALQSTLASTTQKANEALLSVGEPIAADATVIAPPMGGGGVGGGIDDGLGSQGCATSGADGHVAPGSPLTAITVGQIICGTAKEYNTLRAAAIDEATRLANQTELLLRMIWHLNLAGFTAGRQRNPSGVISADKLSVQVSGIFRAYDVFQGVGYDIYLPVHMIQVFPADYLAEAGTPD